MIETIAYALVGIGLLLAAYAVHTALQARKRFERTVELYTEIADEARRDEATAKFQLNRIQRAARALLAHPVAPSKDPSWSSTRRRLRAELAALAGEQ